MELNNLYIKMVKRASKEFIPLNVLMEITLNCNERCLHCYNFDRSMPMPKEIKIKTLTTEKILSNIDEVSQAGALHLTLSGGEPLVHPDIFEIIAHARARGLLVRLKTNATKITEGVAEKLSQFFITQTDVSLYGVDPETHDWFTRLPGSFDKTIAGLKNSRDFNLNPNIEFVMNKRNFRQLEKMDQLAKSLGIDYVPSCELTSRHDGSDSSQNFSMTADDLRELTSTRIGENYAGQINPNQSVQCPCARDKCAIAFDGTVYPCIGAPIPSGNINVQSFIEIWQNSPQFNEIRGITIDDFPKCKSCSIQPYCQRSSGTAYVNTGDYYAVESKTCEQTQVFKGACPQVR